MPTPLSCRSSSALDSLPRNANARRSGTALHRLQEKQRLKQHQSKDAEFWRDESSRDGVQLTGSAQSSASSSSSPVPPRRLSNQFGARRRKPSNTTKYDAVSSGDLPLASSDLYVAQGPPDQCRDAFSDGEEEFGRSAGFDETSSIRIIGHRRGDGPRPRTLSLSPQKMYQPIMMPIQSNDSDEETTENVSKHSTSGPRPLSPTKRQQAQPARKRVITKDMIGKPTNFQHTGHIGAGAYTGITTGGVYDDEKLKQQLSEVAAALRMEDSASSNSHDPSKGSESTLADEEASLPSSKGKETSNDYECQGAPVFAATPAADTSKPTNGVRRTTSKRKPVPAPRKLSELYSEFTTEPSAPYENRTSSPVALTRAIAEEGNEEFAEDEQENLVAFPVATIRASNGKRLVEGPSGALITETANGRWNKALNEITLALKDESYDDGDESADVDQSLDRADAILRRLNAL